MNFYYFIIFLIVFVNFLGYGIIYPLIPLIGVKFGANDLLATLLIAVYPLFQFIAAPILGVFSDRYGRKPLLLYSLFGTAISFLIMVLAPNLLFLFLGRILDGISGGNVTIAQAYMADITSKKERSAAMGIISMGISLGFTIGPVIGGFLGNINYQIPLILALLISLITIFLTFFFLPESLRQKDKQKTIKILPFDKMIRVVSIPELTKLLVLLFFYVVTFSSVFATFALFLKEKFLMDSFQSGLFFGFRGTLAFIVLFLLLKRSINIFGEKNVLKGVVIFYIIGLFVTGISSSVITLILGISLIEGGGSLIRPIIFGIVSKRTDPSIQGEVLGIAQSIASLAKVIGPFLAGFILQFFGHTLVYYLQVIILGMMLFYLQFIYKPKARFLEENNHKKH